MLHGILFLYCEETFSFRNLLHLLNFKGCVYFRFLFSFKFFAVKGIFRHIYLYIACNL